MSGYRQIHTKIWKDGWFIDLSPEEKLLFIYLFSNDRANLIGLYDLPLKVIAFETDLSRDTIDAALQNFTRTGKAHYKDGWVWVPNMMTYNANNLASEKVRRHVELSIADVPDSCPFKAAWIRQHYPKQPEPAPEPAPDTPISAQDTVSDGMDTVSIPILHEHEHEHDHEQIDRIPEVSASQPPKRQRARAAPDPNSNGSEHKAIFGELVEFLRLDQNLLTNADRGRINALSKRIRDGDYTLAQLQEARSSWYSSDWRGKKGDPPANDRQLLAALSRQKQARAGPQTAASGPYKELDPWQ